MKEEDSSFIPIYKQLFEHYRAGIISQKYPPGSIIGSINGIQKRHSISRETAKRVLKKLAQEGLIIQKAGKGSFVADLGPRQKVWGVIVPFLSARIENLLFLLKAEAAKIKREIEYFVDYNNPTEEMSLVGDMINKRFEAIIIIPVSDESQTAEFYRNLVTGGTVVSLLDHTMAGSYFTYIIQSYDLGIKRAVTYLLKQTKKNIAFFKNETWAGRNMVQELMENSFKYFIDASSAQKAIVVDGIRHLNKSFIEKNNIGGILCCDDVDAIRIIGRLKAMKVKIPNDVSLISYGNTELARYFTPEITSIDSKDNDMIKKTMEIINAKIIGENTTFSQFVIQPDIVIRET